MQKMLSIQAAPYIEGKASDTLPFLHHTHTRVMRWLWGTRVELSDLQTTVHRTRTRQNEQPVFDEKLENVNRACKGNRQWKTYMPKLKSGRDICPDLGPQPISGI